jgi:hypothetical protein
MQRNFLIGTLSAYPEGISDGNEPEVELEEDEEFDSSLFVSK